MLWGQISGGCHCLTLNKFFFYYKPKQIVAPKDFYNFVVRKPSLKLVTGFPDSNHDLKSRYFFVQGSNWVCRPNKWDNIREEYDNTWGILYYFGKSLIIA